MNPMSLIKFVGAWVCIILAVALLIIGSWRSPGTAVAILALLALAFSMAPTSW